MVGRGRPLPTWGTGAIRDSRKPRTTSRGGGGTRDLVYRPGQDKKKFATLPHNPANQQVAQKLAARFSDVTALTSLREAAGGPSGGVGAGRFSEGLSVDPVRNGGGLSPLTLYRQALLARGRAPSSRSSVSSQAGGGPAPALSGDVLGRLMGAIRTKESGGNYKAVGIPTKYGRASGAYQFLDSTWGGFGGYKRAADAPPAVQDARARQMMGDYLRRFGGDPAKVAIAWYAGPAAVGRANMTQSQNGGRMPSINAYAQAIVRLMGR